MKKLTWTLYDGDNEEHGVSWDVTYPDTSFGDHFRCCGKTNARMFDTWFEAMVFALSRPWDR